MAWAVTVRESIPARAGTDRFERLFVEAYPHLRAIAMRAGLDEDEAEDIAQEAFVQFHRRYPADATFAHPWLRRAALHLALNALRTRRRRDEREQREASGDVAHGVNPAARLERDERRAAVRAVMARLPKRYSAVLALRYSGASYAEIAAALDMPTGHVGTTLRRAERAFKKEFDHASLG